MIPNLASVLANRKKFVDEVSEVGTSMGTGPTDGEFLQKSKFSDTSFIAKSSTGYIGLQNQGATCYLNSLLQSLFMIPEFRQELFSFNFDPDFHGDEKTCLTRQLQVGPVENLLNKCLIRSVPYF